MGRHVTAKTEKMVIDFSSKPNAAEHILPGKSVVGDLTLGAKLTYDGKAIGDARFLGQFLGREADIREIGVNTLDGNATGNAVVALERPLEAHVTLNWEKVRVGPAGRIVPRPQGARRDVRRLDADPAFGRPAGARPARGRHRGRRRTRALQDHSDRPHPNARLRGPQPLRPQRPRRPAQHHGGGGRADADLGAGQLPRPSDDEGRGLVSR